MGKKSPASKQNTLISATQTTMKWQDEIVAELSVRIANLQKTVEQLQTTSKLPDASAIPFRLYNFSVS